MKNINKIFIALIIILCCASSAFAVAAQFDKYGGWTGSKGIKTGVFHAEKINDRWWLITPEGNVFWSTGMYCVRISGIPETGTGERAYREACLKKYGSAGEWTRITRKRLYEWGFNTIGDWSSDSIYREPGFAYVIGMDLPRKAENVIAKGAYGYFPDVFSQEFRDSVKEQMAEKFKNQPYLIDDPWLLGYFLADEPSWYGSKGRRGSLVDDFISLDGTKAGKKSWVEFIKTRYSTIDALNKSWETKLKNLDELGVIKEIKDNQSTIKDKLDFLRVIAEEFSKVLHTTLREYDKYHMILGTRPSRLYPEVLEGLSKYEDVFCTTAHDFNPGYNIDPEYYEKIDNIYKNTKKPILLGVLIAAQDSGYPFATVRTQKDRGISYWRYLAKVASHPAVVGLHWFQYFDPPKKCYDEKAANWGVVNQSDEPYTEATELIAEANKMVYAYALGLTDFTPGFNATLDKDKKEAPAYSRDSAEEKGSQIAISNSDFEQGNKSWSFQTWKGKSRASLDSRTKHSGKTSLKIEGGPDEGWGSVGVATQGGSDLVLKPGAKYRLLAWIKTDKVENTAFVRIKVKYKNGDEAYFGTEGAYGTQDWKQIAVEFSPREENVVQYLGAQLTGRGTAWFDDISLEELK